MTQMIERQTSRIPSGLFVVAAGASIIGSLVSFLTGRKQFANLVGEWVPTFLLLGIYGKMARMAR